jgi:long-subunit fatty acid transport protein
MIQCALMKRCVATLAVAAAAVLGAREASAQAVQNIVLRNSFNPLGAGARGLGMGGAFIGVADDGTAASFNPAGLAQLRRTEIAVVGFTDELRVTQHVGAGPNPGPNPGPGTIDLPSARHGAVDFAGLSVPFDVGGKNLTVELSYQRAVDLFGQGTASTADIVPFKDLKISQPGNASIVANVSPEQSGAFHVASLATAYQATSRLSLGAAVNVWVANWSDTGNVDFRVSTNPPPGRPPVVIRDSSHEFDQKQSMRGLNANLGFLLKYPRLSLGGVLRLPFAGDYNLTETGKEKVADAGQAAQTTDVDISVGSRLRWPRSAGLGLALRPFKGMTLAGDYTRSHWSRTAIEQVPGGALLTPANTDASAPETFTDLNFFDLLPASETATTDTSQWRAGGEYLVNAPKIVVPLRGGWFRDRSPVRDLATDEGRRIKGWTAGSGLNFSRVVLDVAFERRQSEGVVGLRLRKGKPVTSGATTESVREDRVVASLIYRAGGDDDPLKRALRYLFAGPKESENP